MSLEWEKSPNGTASRHHRRGGRPRGPWVPPGGWNARLGRLASASPEEDWPLQLYHLIWKLIPLVYGWGAEYHAAKQTKSPFAARTRSPTGLRAGGLPTWSLRTLGGLRPGDRPHATAGHAGRASCPGRGRVVALPGLLHHWPHCHTGLAGVSRGGHGLENGGRRANAGRELRQGACPVGPGHSPQPRPP